mmetsp:Transcript_96765/g.276392  ORF Transcript_96765/g.276392 Transcript_96765/m.276392 type:complete len:263 (-) Transcript_96765:616-1404(-)
MSSAGFTNTRRMTTAIREPVWPSMPCSIPVWSPSLLERMILEPLNKDDPKFAYDRVGDVPKRLPFPFRNRPDEREFDRATPENMLPPIPPPNPASCTSSPAFCSTHASMQIFLRHVCTVTDTDAAEMRTDMGGWAFSLTSVSSSFCSRFFRTYLYARCPMSVRLAASMIHCTMRSVGTLYPAFAAGAASPDSEPAVPAKPPRQCRCSSIPSTEETMRSCDTDASGAADGLRRAEWPGVRMVVGAMSLGLPPCEWKSTTVSRA